MILLHQKILEELQRYNYSRLGRCKISLEAESHKDRPVWRGFRG